MPEQYISRGKYNFNKQQKEKQNKILQYYRRSFKSQLAPVRESNRPRRTRKQHYNTITNPIADGIGRFPKLTKTHSLASEPEKENSLDRDKEQKSEQKINLEKTEITKPPAQKSGDNQYVIMD
jgi:hypothetical protein